MTKWRVIQGKFTKREHREVLKFMKKNGIESKNELVVNAIRDYIGVSIADGNKKENQALPKGLFSTDNFYLSLKDEFKTNPKILEKMNEFYQTWRKKFIDDSRIISNLEVRKAGKLYDKFERDPVGRPKDEKKGPGRPSRKDTSL